MPGVLDTSMMGPLDAAEQALWGAWSADFEGLSNAVPRSPIADAAAGPWRIEHFGISEAESRHLLRKDIRNGRAAPGFWTPPGTYSRLTADAETFWGFRGEIMVDTRTELAFIAGALAGASGDLLECGLGLGLLVRAALLMPAVNSITVVEVDADVMAMVAPYVADPRVTIVHADFREWAPPAGASFSRAIFDTIAAHNSMAVVERYSAAAADMRFYENDPRGGGPAWL